MSIEILDDLHDCNVETLISTIGSLITVIENMSFAYDDNDAIEQTEEVLNDHDIRYQLVEDI